MAAGGASGAAGGRNGDGGSGGRGRAGHRQAVPGMIEVLILTSIAVVGIGVLAVWMGALDEAGWRADSYRMHCTLNIVMFEDVGSGLNFFSVRLTNTGEQTMHGVYVVTGSTVQYNSTGIQPPGTGSYFAFSSTHMRPETVDAVATYEDGSTSLCVKRWNTGVSG